MPKLRMVEGGNRCGFLRRYVECWLRRRKLWPPVYIEAGREPIVPREPRIWLKESRNPLPSAVAEELRLKGYMASAIASLYYGEPH